MRIWDDLWAGSFGHEYTDRSPHQVDELDAAYAEKYGISRTEMNAAFLSAVPKSARILEVACNVGVQLRTLESMGFTELYGLELQWYAVDRARELMPRANILQGSAFDIPFKDGWFDLVFTSGLLIHIAPTDLPTAIREIARCSKQWIWGFEYYSPAPTEIEYRGQSGVMWKRDFAQAYLDTVPGMSVVDRRRYKYTTSSNEDEMFLLTR